MGHLRMKADECGYKGKERRLKEQFINDIDDYDDMMTNLIQELTRIKKTNEVSSKQVSAKARRDEVQWAQKVKIEATRESTEFEAMKKKVTGLSFGILLVYMH